MTRRRWIVAVVVVVAAVVLCWWSIQQFQRDEKVRLAAAAAEQVETGSPNSEQPSAPSSGGSSPPDAAPTNRVPAPPNPGATVGTVTLAPPSSSGSAIQPLAKGEPANIEGQLDQVNLMLRDYRTIGGANPVGTNAEIMKAIMGDNARHATLGPPAGQVLNGQGELIDRWGTPYFFHQLSGVEMEIRSAGPDGQMWTADDQTMTSATGAVQVPRH